MPHYVHTQQREALMVVDANDLRRIFRNDLTRRAEGDDEEDGIEYRSRTVGHIDLRSSGPAFMDAMYDVRWSKRVNFQLISSLDEEITVQVIGGYSEDAARDENQHTAIGSPVSVGANDWTNTPINLDNNFIPFLGIKVPSGQANTPTTGRLTLRASSQDSIKKASS